MNLFAEESPNTAAAIIANHSKPIQNITPKSEFIGRSQTKPVANDTGSGPVNLSQPSLVTGGILQVTLGLFVVLMVIAGAAWFARRFGNFNIAAKGNLRIIGGLHMGSRERVVLMQVGDTQILLGVSPGRIQTLHVLDKPVEINDSVVGSDSSPIQRFSTLLKRAQQK